MADPLLVAARENLAESLDEIGSTIDGLSVEQLNARVAGEGTNPIESTRAWVSIAVGREAPPRDRPAEFRTVVDGGFAGWVDGRVTEILAILDGAATFDPALEVVARWRPDDPDDPVSAAWALLHAIAHLGEHVGHAHVMRDVLRGGAAPV